MARTRSIKPGFFLNTKLADLEPLARLLFAGLWCVADRRGRLPDDPRRIKVETLPYDECDVALLLAQLAQAGFILRYAIAGTAYIQVVQFERHQHVHIKEPESTIPAPVLSGAYPVPGSQAFGTYEESPSGVAHSFIYDQSGARTVLAPDENGSKTSDHLPPDHLPPSSPAGPVRTGAGAGLLLFRQAVGRDANAAEQKSLAAWLGRDPPPAEYAVRYGLEQAAVSVNEPKALLRYAIRASESAPRPEQVNAGYQPAPELSPEVRANYERLNGVGASGLGSARSHPRRGAMADSKPAHGRQ